MPALTHNRVKNGFNGGIRKKNARMGVKNARVAGATKADASRKKALIGGIGGKSIAVRRAIKNRVMCECKKQTKRVTYTVTVVKDANNNNKYIINGNASLSLKFEVDTIYTFDLSHTSNSGHPLQLVTTSGGSTLYPSQSTIGTAGTSGAKVIFTPQTSGTVFIKCSVHGSGMGSNYNSPGIQVKSVNRINYTVTVATDANNNNKYIINGNTSLSLNFEVDTIYTFDLSDATNGGHPLQLVTTLNGSTLYLNQSTVGTAGAAGAKVIFTPQATGTVFIKCSVHGSGMGSNYNSIGIQVI